MEKSNVFLCAKFGFYVSKTFSTSLDEIKAMLNKHLNIL